MNNRGIKVPIKDLKVSNPLTQLLCDALPLAHSGAVPHRLQKATAVPRAGQLDVRALQGEAVWVSIPNIQNSLPTLEGGGFSSPTCPLWSKLNDATKLKKLFSH